ncbi:phosphotransferase, partial [Thermodesulfobacteriota bacterium]
MTQELHRLIDALSRPEAYPHRPASVQVIQTHASVVFLAGELVYKVKKAVDFGFLDFSTLDKRKHYCRQEVRLNSRFSEGIYLGVVPVFEGERGIDFEGPGYEIDFAVLMKRFPEDRTLINMLAEERVSPEILDRMADRIAHFHSQAPTGPHVTGFGSLEVISHNVKENFDQTESYTERTLPTKTRLAIVALTTDFLMTHGPLFRERMRDGFIRDCHGDLHLEHVLVLDDIYLFDCIEFNERFRYCDTAADLGFLLMGLDFRGYPAFARRVAQRYSAVSGDAGILDLIRFYMSYRAFIRGKVRSFEIDDPEVPPAARQLSGHCRCCWLVP